MINAILGKKITQIQVFLEDGNRVPVTRISVPGNPVISHRTMEKNGYIALQVGLGTKKRPNKAMTGHIRGANQKVAPRFLREVKVTADGEVTPENLPALGTVIVASDVLKVGDMVDVMGVSKGKGYAGVVKRYKFKGGPRTHGQSDRERHPGSIGQTTTPGRVYRGKRMAGHMGVDNVTVRNLSVIEVNGDEVLIKGLVPGVRDSLVIIEKTGEDKKFVPMHKITVEEPATEVEEVMVEEAPIESPVVAEEKVEEKVVKEEVAEEKTNE